MTVKLPVQQYACACLLGAAMSVNSATASGLQVAPVTLTLQASQNADGIWLSNAGENVLNAFRNFAERDVRFHIVKPNYEGIRIAFRDEEAQGWLLLRMSLHDPVMPMNIEAESAGGVAVIRERIRPFFSKYTELALR